MSRQHKPRPRAAAVMAAITDPLTITGWPTTTNTADMWHHWLPILGPTATITLDRLLQGYYHGHPLGHIAHDLGVNVEALRRAIARLHTFNILDVRDGTIALRHVNNPPAHLVNRQRQPTEAA